jgi:hypothetical protein
VEQVIRVSIQQSRYSTAAARKPSIQYSRQLVFPPHATFSYYMFRESSRHFAKNITHVRMAEKGALSRARSFLMCLQRCCSAHRSLSLFFFSFSTARHDILTRFYESIYSHVREVGFPSTVLQAKSKNQILQPSAKRQAYPIPYRCGSGIPDLH